MRFEACVTSVAWIPLGAVAGLTKLPFAFGVAHYDPPPPDRLGDLPSLFARDAVRFANELRAWIDVHDGAIHGWGYSGGGHLGSTTLRLGDHGVTFPAVAFPDLRQAPAVHSDHVRFVQTAGGRTGVAVPHPVPHWPYLRLAAPTAWSTLALTIATDGTNRAELVGASAFPRHWVYDDHGELVAKSGLIDYATWFHGAFGAHTPWGGEDSPAVVSAVESALERTLSRVIIDSDPEFRHLGVDATLCEQGDQGDELFLLFDGLLAVEIDGRVAATVGPGAILGEMALLAGGRRTATLRARTECRVAVVPGDRIDRTALAEVAKTHRHAQQAPSGTGM